MRIFSLHLGLLVLFDWRNEWTAGECCSLESGDQLDWVRAKYGWGLEESITIFGTEQHAKKYYILVGTQERLDPRASAMFVSDPIQCQEGDAHLSFRYWTSPRTSVRVCIRNTSTIKDFDWCSSDITKNDPGPAQVLIPGSIMYDFEIVIEARNFSYDAFGFQGGVVIIDEIRYNASTVYNCRNIPHVEPVSDATCALLSCNFEENQSKCVQSLESSGWRLSSEPTAELGLMGNGAFAFATSSGAKNQQDLDSEIAALQKLEDDDDEDLDRRKKRGSNKLLFHDRQLDGDPLLPSGARVNTLLWNERLGANRVKLQQISGNTDHPKLTASPNLQLIGTAKTDRKLNELIDALDQQVDDTAEKQRARDVTNVTQQQTEASQKALRLKFVDFELPRQLILEFCVYLSTLNDRLAVECELSGYNKSRLLGLDSTSSRLQQWHCPQLILQAGHYKTLEFAAFTANESDLLVGLDGLKLYELDGYKCACPGKCPDNTADAAQTTPGTLLARQKDLSEDRSALSLLPKVSVKVTKLVKLMGKSRRRPGNKSTTKVKSANGKLIGVDEAAQKFGRDHGTPLKTLDPDSVVLKSFAIRKDDTYTPRAEPLPHISRNYMQFGDFDDKLQPLDFSTELVRLPRRRVLLF